MKNKALFQNKYRVESTRLKYWDYSNPGFYFVTICTKDRIKMFGEIVNEKMILNRLGLIVKHCWHDLSNHYKNCILDSFIVMPNHFHGIIKIKDVNSNKHVEMGLRSKVAIRVAPVEMIHESSLRESPNNNHRIERRKMLLSKIVGRFKMQSSKKINLINHTICFRWQISYYEHIIRTEQDLWKCRKYITDNPANWKNDKNYKF